ncbi:hypothetical protein [Actinopolymorpha pittospori]|uniref:Uncharacterized protein n=1 Tax=Actinopolymorpha pittospori TaxID=648752 RepID=A0A927RKL0_9ACTN|nr:hypothetical protein [Actinopolymorpha pittospori]MBE1608356.1 hypothetical protein [Actinopolymorpha pittospori]
MTRVDPATTGPTGRDRRAGLSERPPISLPHERRHRSTVGAGHAWSSRQPGVGLLGLLLVVPVAAVLAVGAGGEGSTLVLGPLITYSLPLVAMLAFWWEDWPGTRLRASWSGWADTALIAVGAIVLTGIGQALAGRLDPVGIFDPSPGPGHVPTFPATMPVAGTAFVAMLQFTLVGEGWPLRRLLRLPAGLLAVAISWAVALVVSFTLVAVEPLAGSDVIARDGPISGGDAGAALVLIGVWQVLFYVVWRGWPFSRIRARVWRLSWAHVVMIAGGILSYVAACDLLGLDSTRVAALAGCFVAAGLLFGMLFEDWLHGRLGPRGERATLLVLTLALAVVLAVALGAAVDAVGVRPPHAQEWVEHASLNALATSIILHVGIGRRWPVTPHRDVAGEEGAN